jgi:hypothetical protein
MTTKTPPESPAAPPAVEDQLDTLLATRRDEIDAERAAALQGWLDHVESARQQIEPLRLGFEVVRRASEARVQRWADSLKDPHVARLRGHGIADTVAWTQQAVSDWLGCLASGPQNLAHATAALEELPTVPVPHRPEKAEWVRTYVERAAGNLSYCERSLEGLEVNMQTITAALAKGHLAPSRDLIVARKYQPDPEAA